MTLLFLDISVTSLYSFIINLLLILILIFTLLAGPCNLQL